MRKIYILFSAELILSIYCLSVSFYFKDLFYLIPLGILFLVFSLLVLNRLNFFRILNMVFSFLVMILYFILFFDLLIKRGFINNLNNPFLLMSIFIHLPVILFNSLIFIFLKINKNEFRGYNI